MSLQLNRAADATLSGQVISGAITGWRLTFLRNGVVFKTTDNPAQIAVLDPVAGTFEIYLSPADLPFGTWDVEMYGVDGDGSTYRLLRDTMSAA